MVVICWCCAFIPNHGVYKRFLSCLGHFISLTYIPYLSTQTAGRGSCLRQGTDDLLELIQSLQVDSTPPGAQEACAGYAPGEAPEAPEVPEVFTRESRSSGQTEVLWKVSILLGGIEDKIFLRFLMLKMRIGRIGV